MRRHARRTKPRKTFGFLWGKNKDITIFILIGIVIIEVIILALLFKRPPAKKEIEKIPAKGKIAIVLDDWGYSLKNLDFLKEIKYPLTVAILPDLVYSKKIAQEAKINHKEVILHMPMEPYPHEDRGLELNTLKIDMPKSKLISLLDDAIVDVPYIKGISNHMGSKATENERIMRIIFNELKKRRLYFLDSFVTSKSIGKKIAQEIKLRFFQRDVFLDNKENAEYIRGQLKELVEVAEKQGQAIGIGHDRMQTLEVLSEEMPRIEEKGFVFVFVSQLVDK